MKRIIIGACALLPLFCYAEAGKVDSIVKTEVQALKKDRCQVSKRSIRTYQSGSGDQQSVLVKIPFEGCGGGNNWGVIVKVFSGYKDGKWAKIKDVNVNSIDSVEPKNNGEFLITSTEYAPSDPHCCPSLKKKIVVKP